MIPFIAFSLIFFLVAWGVSALVIFIGSKLIGEREGIGTAAAAALVGSFIYLIAWILIGRGLGSSLFAALGWLTMLRALYKIGWVKALALALIVWALASIIGLVLPTLPGPL
jgi:hypothetical protein